MAALDDLRFGLHRALREIRQDFSGAMPCFTGARAAESARLTMRWMGERSRPNGRLRDAGTHGRDILDARPTEVEHVLATLARAAKRLDLSAQVLNAAVVRLRVHNQRVANASRPD